MYWGFAMSRLFQILTAVVILQLCSAEVDAGPQNSKLRPLVFEELISCRDITEPSQRLACYDKKSNTLDDAERNEQLIVTDVETMKEARRGLFGFNLPKLQIFGTKSEDEVQEINTKIASAYLKGSKWLVVLDDGAKWQQSDSEELRRRPVAGMPIKINKAAMGSFFVNVDGQRAVRMKRVN
jgi:hypothetical protein